MKLAGLPAVSFLILGCGDVGLNTEPQTSNGYRIETVARGLEVPWAIAWTPDGRLIVTERPGRVRQIVNGRLHERPLHVFADVESSGETGLMGLAIHPKFDENHWIYFSYAYRFDRVRVVRFRLSSGDLVDKKVIVDDIPSARLHAGCALSFGPDGKLYITTGDGTDRDVAQDLAHLGGKTLRVYDDGTIPNDNPFTGKEGARGEIWTLGHRNSQGIAWQPGTNLMFQSEHGPSGFDGPSGGDEVNLVERGRNYGWPEIHHEERQEGMVSPLVDPGVAPGGCAFYTGDRLPQFKGDLFVAGLRGESLVRMRVVGSRIVGQRRLITGYGRIRAVATGPDGGLYFTTSNHDGRGSPHEDDDRILRIVPTA